MSKLFALIFISSVLFFTQCKKYPEGPSISFISKKERFIGQLERRFLAVDDPRFCYLWIDCEG